MKQTQKGWISLSDSPLIQVTPTHRGEKPIHPTRRMATLGAQTSAKITVSSFLRASPFRLPVQIKKTNQDHLQVGPFIGILTSDGKRQFRGNQQNFADLIRMGRKMGVAVFVLTPTSFQPKSSFVSGYLLDPRSQKNRWLKTKNLPYPNIIYNRIPDRTAETQSMEQSLIKRLQQHPKIHFFNAGFFNKWDLYQTLQSAEEWRFLIPTTKPLSSMYTLSTMTEQYPNLYLKPINGKAGIGLIKITRKDQQYRYIYQGEKEKKRTAFPKLRSLWKQIQQDTHGREYVIQQEIPLTRYHQRPCDFRVLVQKDGQGKWQLTGVGVRVAGKEAISTHVPMGGQIAKVQPVLRSLFPDHHTYIHKKLAQKALGIARFIEKQKKQSLGEMSMDFGIESNGRMWFFEANAKPMKFDEPEIRSRSLQRLIQYSLHLSGYPQATGEKKR